MEREQIKKKTTGMKGKGKGRKTKSESQDKKPTPIEQGSSKPAIETKPDVSVDMNGPSVAIDLESPQGQEEEDKPVNDVVESPQGPEDDGDKEAVYETIENIEDDYEVPVITVEKNNEIKTNDDKVKISQQKNETESIDFSSINPEDYGLEVDEDDLPPDFVYEPPPQTDLPDLYNLLASLEEGDGDLVTKDPPPSLFAIPEHIPSYSKISELRLEIEEDELKPYISRFDTRVKDDVILLGKISLEEVQEEEKRLRDEHILYLEQESRLAREREEKLINREEQAKTRMATFVKDKRTDLARREELLRQKEKLMLDHIHKAFRRAESQLIGTLERRKGEVKTLYGDLMLADGQYGGSKGRRWKVDWNRTPQPIKINLKCLRGVKDKLPGGRYVMMASLYNRLGGHTMKWSKLKGQTWGGTTLPMFHEGNFYNTEMKINQSLFTVLPAKSSLRPEVSGYSVDHDALVKESHHAFLHENALNPMIFPSLRRMETEILSMSADMLNGDEEACGFLTTGGTESVLMAVKTYRDRAQKLFPHIKQPEIIAPITAHPVIEKAAHYFGLSIIRTPIGPDFKADVKAMERAITSNTILLVGSAPQFCHGIVDDIDAISDLAVRVGLPLHIDACFGGFMLPWVEKLGYDVPKWDFRCPGVTSISADIHKYGYTVKGSSVVVYRNAELRKHQIFVYAEWPGGLYGSPSMAGTRGGGNIAASWVCMRSLGKDGYERKAKELMDITSLKTALIR